MKKLQYKIMSIMMTVVVLSTLFVGILLIFNMAESYNRDFLNTVTKICQTDEFLNAKKSCANKNDYFPITKVFEEKASLLNNSSNKNYYIFENETLVYSNKPGGEIKISKNLQSAFDGKVLSNQRNYFNNDYALKIENTDFILYVKDDMTVLNKSITNIFYLLLQAIFAGVILAFLLSFLLSKTITEPIKKLQNATHLIPNENFEIDIKGKDEITKLSQTFVEMNEKLIKSQKEQKYQRMLLFTILEKISHPVCAFDSDEKILFANDAFHKNFKKIDNLLKLKKILDIPKNSPIKIEKSSYNIDYQGKNYIVECSKYNIDNDDKNGYIFVFSDISILVSSQFMQNQFVENASHELKTPLTVIKSYTQTLIQNEVDSKTSQSFLKVIDQQSDYMNEIIQTLLELEKIKSKPLNCESVNIKDVILECIKQIKEINDDVNFILDLKDIKLDLSKNQIKMAFLNILSNAIKYSKEEKNIYITQKNDEKYVEIRFKDDGIGISNSDLKHIFEKFYRADKARSRQTGGTGLGLSITKQIIENHGGKISAESELGKQTTFIVKLPYKKDF